MAKVNQFRTADELKDSTFNYFVAFKIKLNEIDKTKIEAQIKKILYDTSGSMLSRRLLELKNDSIEIMCEDAIYDSTNKVYRRNAGGRAKEAQAAKALKLKEALDVVQILCKTRKVLFKSEIRAIYVSVNSPIEFFTLTEFDKSIAPLLSVGIKIIDNAGSSIPFDKYQKIEQLLKSVNKKDLYDFLECKATATRTDLEESKNQQYKASQKLSNLRSKQAASALCCAVQEQLLSSPQARKSYDNYLALKDEVWSEFEKRKAFGIKELTIEEYTTYTQIVVNTLKISVDEAEKMLTDGCKFFQFTLVGIC